MLLVLLEVFSFRGPGVEERLCLRQQLPVVDVWTWSTSRWGCVCNDDLRFLPKGEGLFSLLAL